ncbi:hypothetical protein H2203_000313 [Taxawa tesnikishii (nom. ined.)]|nr:hypothetical protein H2203_000313 [Dothideales sp. JES 119]
MSQASTTPSHRDSIASDADTADTASTAETVDTDASGTTGYSSASDFAFDGQLGWNPRTMPGVTAENQRQRWSGFGSSLAGVRTQSSGPLNNRDNSVPKHCIHVYHVHGSERKHIRTARQHPTPASPRNNATNNPSTTSLAQQPTNASTASTSSASLASTTTTNNNNNSARPPKPPPRLPRIVKRTSVDQMSEHVDLTHGDGMSDAGSASSSEWRGSDHDTSGLSVEQIHKLKKKGINPALYAEMKAARKGSGKKRWAPTLAGNAFLG